MVSIHNGLITPEKKKRVGHLFQGRFKAILVDKDNYLLELCRYVVLNPLRAKKDLSEIPKQQRRRVYALSTYFKGVGQIDGVASVYYSGGYSQREIAAYHGCHYRTVSRRLKLSEGA